MLKQRRQFFTYTTDRPSVGFQVLLHISQYCENFAIFTSKKFATFDNVSMIAKATFILFIEACTKKMRGENSHGQTANH